MPELPEVETVRLGLEELLLKGGVGVVISSVELLRKTLRTPISVEFRKMKNQQVLSVSRRAKYLLLSLPEGVILSHLGMTGKWRIKGDGPTRKHDHAIFHLDDGRQLIYNDVRRFGILEFSPHQGLQNNKWLKSLGPEPLEKNEFNNKYFYEVCKKRSVAIKTLIMDQKVVVGVGNIYASEALFLAGLRPQGKSNRLSKVQTSKLVAAIRRVIGRAIKSGGTTIRDFAQADGGSGYFAVHLKVYGREGQPCKKCDSKIRKVIIGGRSTFWCNKCQS